MQLNGCAPNCRSLLKNNDEELERKIRQDHLYRDRHKCEPERLSAPTMSENFHLDGILDTDAPAFPLLDARNPNWEYTGPPPKTPGNLRVFPEAAWTSDGTCFAIPWSFFKILCKDCGINLQSGIGPMKFLLRQGCPKCSTQDVKVLGMLYTDPPADVQMLKRAMNRALQEFPDE